MKANTIIESITNIWIKMKKIIIYILLMFPLLVMGQTTTQNYVKTTSYQVATQTGSVSDEQKIESISYYDGLGRTKQSVGVKAGGAQQNIVQLITYDSLGRTSKQYLPYASPTVVTNPLSFTNPTILKGNIEGFYNTEKYEHTLNPYSETLFEESPLNRPLRQGAPGNSWAIQKDTIADHTIHYIYTTNTVSTQDASGDDVLDFEVVFLGNNMSQPSLQLEGIHQENRLTKTITQDENFEQRQEAIGEPPGPFDPPLQAYAIVESGDHAIEEYTNQKGQIVLKRTYDEGIAHDTYYIYDDFGNLGFVLSPEASRQIVTVNGTMVSNYQQILDELGFQYKYDHRHRLIEKKVPGKGWEYIVYNQLDQPILTQDANQRSQSPREWLFTKYDAFGRIAYTGIKRTNISRTTFQTVVDNHDGNAQYETMTTTPTVIAGTTVYYTNTAVPAYLDPNADELLTINYYDSYPDLGGLNFPNSVYGQAITTSTKGLPTMSKVRVLDHNDWITTVTAYDEKARSVYSARLNTYLNTQDISEFRLDFTGKILENRTTHQKAGHSEVVTTDYFTYDHQNRLLTQLQQVDEESLQLIASNTYDELGQLESKKVGGALFESGYTDITSGRIEVSEEGVISKIAGGASYNAGLATIGKIEGDGGISFINLTENKRYIIGLNDNSEYTNSTGEIDYSFFFHWTNPGRYRVRIRENNTSSYITGYITYNANDHFAIEREGDVLSFIQNGSVVATHTMAQSFPSLVGDMVMYDEGTQISSFNLYATTITNSLQKVDYQYNVRGWLTDINDVDFLSDADDLFNFHINYDQKEGITTTGSVASLYNGNIAQTIWSSNNADTQKRSYGYAYDALNRINGGFSRKGNNFNTVDAYSLYNVSYDQNGNIQGLKRNGDNQAGGYVLMDDLSYTYDGNQLQKVTDATGHSDGFNDSNSFIDYSYDVNGNMLTDANKGISNIDYNHLNLPTQITINNTSNNENGTIDYVYDATGIKQSKLVRDNQQSTTVTTSYAGGYIYEDINGTESLKMFSHPEGYVEPVYNSSKSVQRFSKGTQTTSFSSYRYVFNYTDHLGNIRLTYADSNGDGAINPGNEIISEKHYYPYGLQQKGYNDIITSNKNDEAEKYKFQGQELEEELGKNTYAYQWRDYDPGIARFNKIDRFAEKYTIISPYAFTANNPIVFREVKGDSLQVADKYRNDINLILEQSFGKNASKFSYSDAGNLVFNGNKSV